MTEEEILHAKPKGTFALLIVYAIVFAAAWFATYWVFLNHGPVN